MRKRLEKGLEVYFCWTNGVISFINNSIDINRAHFFLIIKYYFRRYLMIYFFIIVWKFLNLDIFLILSVRFPKFWKFLAYYIVFAIKKVFFYEYFR